VREHHHQSLWRGKDQTWKSEEKERKPDKSARTCSSQKPSEAHQSKSLSGQWDSDPAGVKDPAEESAMFLRLNSMAEGKHTSHTLAVNEGLDFWLVCVCECLPVCVGDRHAISTALFFRAETWSDLSVSGLQTPNPHRDRTQRETALLKLTPSQTGSTV